MRKLKYALAVTAVMGLALSPVSARAGSDNDNAASDPVQDVVKGVGCVVVTAVTLPLLILTGKQHKCD